MAIRSAVGSRGLPALTCLLHPSLDSESPRPPPTVLPPVLLTGPGSICPRKVTWEMLGFPHRTFRTGHPEASQPLGTSLGFWALAMRFSGPHDLWESSDPRAGISGRFLGQVAPIARGSAHRLSARHPAQGPPRRPSPRWRGAGQVLCMFPWGTPITHQREFNSWRPPCRREAPQGQSLAQPGSPWAVRRRRPAARTCVRQGCPRALRVGRGGRASGAATHRMSVFERAFSKPQGETLSTGAVESGFQPQGLCSPRTSGAALSPGTAIQVRRRK